MTLDSSATSQPVAFATGASPGDKAYFFSDSSDLVVDCKNGELRLRPPTQWTMLQEQLDAGGTVTLRDLPAEDISAALAAFSAPSPS